MRSNEALSYSGITFQKKMRSTGLTYPETKLRDEKARVRWKIFPPKAK